MPPKKKAPVVKEKKEVEAVPETEEPKVKKPRGRKAATPTEAPAAKTKEPPKTEEPPVTQEPSKTENPPKAQKGGKATKASKAAKATGDNNQQPPEEVEEAPKRSKRAGTTRNYAETEDAEVEQQQKPAASTTNKQSKKKTTTAVENNGSNEVPAKRGRKPKAPEAKADENEEEEPEKKNLMNQTETLYDKISFACTKVNKAGKKSNFCIASWNVDGIRAWIKKDGLTYLEYEKPDVFCVQESKCSEDKLPPDVKDLEGYKQYWHNSDKEGYAGVGLFSRTEPLDVKYGIGLEEHDDEGRCVTAEYDKFYVVAVYVPNAGRKLVTLPKRLEWNKAFKSFIKELDKKKPTIICGDMNVAHTEIDLANPKTNIKNAGFTKEEREGMTEFLADGYVDTFRELYPDKTGAYTFWSYMMKSRSKNIGWRLDYFIVSEKLQDSICDNLIRSEVYGSDHCPIALFLNI